MRSYSFVLLLSLSAAAQEADPRLDAAKGALRDVQGLFRETPEDFDGIAAGIEKARELAKGTPLEGEVAEFDKLLAIRRRWKASRERAIELLTSAKKSLEAGEDPWNTLTIVEQGCAAVEDVRWLPKATEGFEDLKVGVLRSAITLAERRKRWEPDWVAMAGAYRIAVLLIPDVPPTVFPASGCQSLLRNADEAMQKCILMPEFTDRFPWKDTGGEATKWAADDWLLVSKDGGDLVLAYPSEGAKERAGLRWMNESVGWKDYAVRMEITCNAGFQVLLRVSAAQQPGATLDFELALQQGLFKPGERTTVQGWVYGGRFHMKVGDKRGRPAFCPPTASRSGGLCFRIPAGTRLTIHKIEVKVLSEDPPK